MKLKLYTCFAAAFVAFGVCAQQKPVATVNVLPNEISVPLYYLSENGKWAAGEFYGIASRINLETYEYEEYYEDDYPGTAALAISNDGLVAGRFGSDIAAPAALWRINSTEWEVLPVPEGCGQYDYCVQGMTGDEKYLVGYGYTSGIYVPVIWTLQDDGSYEAGLLPYPDADIWGSTPQMVICQGISDDAQVVYGRIVDYTGFVYLAIVWKKDSSTGSWNYETLGEDYVIIGDSNPGPQPEESDYVTADPDEDMDGWFDQMESYSEALSEWWDLAGEYARLATSSSLRLSTSQEGISSNGRYLCVNIPDEPRVYDLSDGSYVSYPASVGGATSVSNDGIILFAYGMLGSYTAYIATEGVTEPVLLSDWLSENYEIEYVDGSSTLGSGIGACKISSDGETIVGWTSSDMMNATNTVIKLGSGASGIVNNQLETITVVGNILQITGTTKCNVNIYDISGILLASLSTDRSIDLSNYANGLVIVTAKTNNQNKAFKVIID